MKSYSRLLRVSAGILSFLLTLPALFSGQGPSSLTLRVTRQQGPVRPSETIEVRFAEVKSRLPEARFDNLLVRRRSDGAVLPSQVTNFQPNARPAVYDWLLFQHSFASGETSAEFTVEVASGPVPPDPPKTFARHIPERLDDFAFENDRLAHRIYGPGLDSPAAGKSRLRSSGIDVWLKRVPYLIVDRWYLKGHDAYHEDTGEGLDLYSVGTNRGCGGTGLWADGQLHVSGNWNSWKILANGPVRTIFELTYGPWSAGGVEVVENKRFIVDAGQNLHTVESTFAFAASAEVLAAIGLTRHQGAGIPVEMRQATEPTPWMTLWEKYPAGQVGCAVLLHGESFAGFAESGENLLLLARVRSGQPLRYRIGAGWEHGAPSFTRESWETLLQDAAAQTADPLSIHYSPLP